MIEKLKKQVAALRVLDSEIGALQRQVVELQALRELQMRLVEEISGEIREKKRGSLNAAAKRQRKQTARKKAARNYWVTLLFSGSAPQSWITDVSDEMLEKIRVTVFEKEQGLLAFARQREPFRQLEKRHGWK